MSTTTNKRRAHWAANRPADFTYAERDFWRCPHDQPGIMTEFWLSETGPTGAEPIIDVRSLPGYTPFRKITDADMSAPHRYLAGALEHYAAVICQCIDDGIDLQAPSRKDGT
jgi:hypothetical protein